MLRLSQRQAIRKWRAVIRHSRQPLHHEFPMRAACGLRVAISPDIKHTLRKTVRSAFCSQNVARGIGVGADHFRPERSRHIFGQRNPFLWIGSRSRTTWPFLLGCDPHSIRFAIGKCRPMGEHVIPVRWSRCVKPVRDPRIHDCDRQSLRCGTVHGDQIAGRNAATLPMVT